MTDKTEVPPSPVVSEVAMPLPEEVATAQAPISDWLERMGKRAGLPSLVVALIALCVSAAGLSYIVANYRLTVAGNRPELASNGFHIELASRPPHVVVDLENIGKKMGRRGTAKLFSMAEAAGAPVDIGTAPIIGAGTNIFPGYGSSARVDSPSIAAAPFFLVCAIYFDDAGTAYEQAFLFQRSTITARDPADLAYAELAAPDVSRCGG
jgi:hypothetical protein